MRHIRRAAVTGLLAVWLAPLSAVAEARTARALASEQPCLQIVDEEVERVVVAPRPVSDQAG
ncbi:hypothetical protein ACVFYP_23975 [Roseomonas sp. F4]